MEQELARSTAGFAGSQIMGMNATKVSGMGGAGMSNYNTQPYGHMLSSNASLDGTSSAAMNYQSNTQRVLEKAKRSRAIRMQVKERMEEKM